MSSTVKSKRAIRARLTLMLALAVAAVSLVATSAQATQIEWLNASLGPHQQVTSGRTSSHMLSHTIYYSGSGTVNVCEQVFDYNTFTVISSKCGNQFAEATPAELEPRLGQLMEPAGGNNSGFTHTIHGVWVE